MSGVPRAHDYVLALAAHIGGGGEEGLSRAYQIGRCALVDGLGVLDMATMHHEALLSLAEASELTRAGLDVAAQEFFAELLSPFEMTFRGYREANERLRSVNEELSRKSGELQTANAELESFSYSVSHDLRAPLRRIAGFSDALVEDFGATLDPEAKRMLGRISEAAAEMARLIDALLELSRVSRGPLDLTRFDVSRHARRVVDLLRADDPSHDVAVVIEDGVHVHADPRLMGAVVQNLLANAWKFSSKQSQPSIEVGRESQGSGFFVRDNGVGFSNEYAHKLFAVFQRLHSADEFEGTGIGLATVQRIVSRHGGSVRAEGEVGRGATFHVLLPEPSDERSSAS